MTGRVSLVEQKRLQWAKEKEEMARLSNHWESAKNSTATRTTVRTRLSSRDPAIRKPLRASENYGSTTSLRTLETGSTSLQSLDYTGSMINILECPELQGPIRKRSPSLPPIHTKESRHSIQELAGLEVEGSRYTNYRRRYPGESGRNQHRSGYEEREGETSGYASDSIEPPLGFQMTDVKRLAPLDKSLDTELSRPWPNPYSETSDTSPPSSRHFSSRLVELNRPRWGSLWNQDHHHPDPPPPSWLERGLSRLDHSSQILVINHESASSPDSSTTGSTGSDSKTYLRGQNIPVDAHVLQEREAKRQKALELQNAIKQQLEEKDRKRLEERERKLREEREEEERILRERNKEKERFEEEQKRLKDKEDVKLKKEMAMREILETAERIAREERRQKRQRDDVSDVGQFNGPEITETINTNELSTTSEAQPKADLPPENSPKDMDGGDKIVEEIKEGHLRLPINKEVAIVLTGRIEDSDFLTGSNLQLLNLIVNSTPRDRDQPSGTRGINAVVKTMGNCQTNSMGTMCSPRFRENRLLTPSKYRNASGRDFGTQTDGENDGDGDKDSKDRKEIVNTSRRDIDKSISTGSTDEKNSRSKSQPRASIDARPRWNANRPGTRYRTQSEKDPHYQRRLRLRRRRVESSDERSRSPSPSRRKSTNVKSKIRNSSRRKVKLEHYDADLSMDSLNSVVPLRIDEHGRINIQVIDNKEVASNCRVEKMESPRKLDMGCGEQIISQLTAMRNGLLFKQQEWDSERCLVSPNTDYY
ncbi:protein split ends [Fopius arisanus]|uniref:Protein split ends n=1 Tax=Fopius arisanus TaxID=64838 RepID=A0A9R1U445_9HYME|nr:PREDICTED: protein split ends [Fopius arisanus]